MQAGEQRSIPRFQFEYRKLGDFTYNVLADPRDIKTLLMHWMMWEWEIDHQENPEEIWTVEWLEALPQMSFTLEVLPLHAIQPRADLMGHSTGTGSFLESLQRRAAEREISMLRGISIEPLLVHQKGFELMDGYTRYMVLRQYQQQEVYAYIGRIE